MILKIVNTTDGRFVGHEFTLGDNPIVLAPSISIPVDFTLPIAGGYRLGNSNYIIDAQGV